MVNSSTLTTAYENVTNFATLGQHSNAVTGGFFGVAIQITVFIVLFVACLRYGGRAAFAVSSFAVVVLSAMLLAMQWIQMDMMIAAVVMMLIAIAVLFIG
jgi:hypothetical protein